MHALPRRRISHVDWGIAITTECRLGGPAGYPSVRVMCRVCRSHFALRFWTGEIMRVYLKILRLVIASIVANSLAALKAHSLGDITLFVCRF